jgi:trk system potassium uptake protein
VAGGVEIGAALNLIGSLIRWFSLAFLLPAAVAVGYGEPVWPFLVSGLATGGVGTALVAATDGRDRVGRREGYLVVSGLWFGVAVLAGLPYLLAEPQLSRPLDALFESMSGISTTGASTLTDIAGLSRSMAMWRQFTAWLGGLGIIVLFLVVLPTLRIGGRHALFQSELAGPGLSLTTSIREAGRRFMVLYVALTLVEILVLAGLGWTGVDPRMTPFNAVAHSFATVATAGVSPEPRSFEGFAPATQWTVIVFMLVAGTNFALLYAGLVRRRARLFLRDDEFRVGVVLVVVCCSIVVLELLTEGILSGGAAVRHGVFITVSMLTTTGFATQDFTDWSPLIWLVLFGMLLSGASAGSTSGSIKLIRHVVIAKMLRREIDHTVHPEVVAPLRVNGNLVDERALRAIIVFVLLYLGVLTAGIVILLLDASLRGIELGTFEAMAAGAAALAGAGSGLGFAGPMGSFEPFSDLSSVVLIALMYLGRLEIVPVLVLFTASHWRG